MFLATYVADGLISEASELINCALKAFSLLFRLKNLNYFLDLQITLDVSSSEHQA